MNRLQEITKRRSEIRAMLENESIDVDLEGIKAELKDLETEERKIIAEMEAQEAMEKRKMEEKRRIASELEAGAAKGKGIDERQEENARMKKYDVTSPEYRMAWAKTIMGRPKAEFTEEEERALGDAIFTTDTTFVASTAEVQGINNGGLLIPTQVRNDILEIISQESPFYRDIRKLAVAGNIELPYLEAADDAEWYTELSDTKNEGQEYRKMQLTGHELAKNVVVTWKLEAMAPEDFINFITEEIAFKMGKALVTAIIYGNGTNKATGAVYDLTPVPGTEPIDAIIKTYKSLSKDYRVGAKAYISTDTNIDIVGYKDANDNYPYLMGLSATKIVNIEVDPYLEDNDILVGNPRHYILNVVEPLSLARESTIKGRKTTYGAYEIADGKPRPGAFALGTYTPAV